MSIKLDTAEAVTNAAIGFLVSVAATYWLLPLWWLVASVGQSFGITAMFFAISTARSFALRRLFRGLK